MAAAAAPGGSGGPPSNPRNKKVSGHADDVEEDNPYDFIDPKQGNRKKRVQKMRWNTEQDNRLLILAMNKTIKPADYPLIANIFDGKALADSTPSCLLIACPRLLAPERDANVFSQRIRPQSRFRSGSRSFALFSSRHSLQQVCRSISPTMFSEIDSMQGSVRRPRRSQKP